MKSTDRIPPWPAQAGWMRAECCCTFLQPLLPPEVYQQVRTAVCRWDLASDPEAVALSEMKSAAVNARYRKAG